MDATPQLERILWTRVVRQLEAVPAPCWEPQSVGAQAIRAVLLAQELDSEEAAVLEDWSAEDAPDTVLLDRLLQTRVDHAVREGLQIEAARYGLAEAPPPPQVVVARQGDAAACEKPAELGASVVSFTALGTNFAGLAPELRLEELVDLLVLADPGMAASLRTNLGETVDVVAARDFEKERPRLDMLLSSPGSAIPVVEVGAELERVEEVLRDALPEELRPPRREPSAGGFSGRDLTDELLGGKYRIKALKGKGGFKTVYEAVDEMLGARVAVAVLNPKGARSRHALESFQDEARVLTTLDHENIVRWITFDRTPDDLHYFVMEYLDGEELEKTLRREGRLAPKRVARILLQVLAALRQAHAPGKHGSLLHLDLKPENVFLQPSLVPGESERVKVIDFGIGQHVGAEVRAAERPELRSVFDLPAEELGSSIASFALEDSDEHGPDSTLATGAETEPGETTLYELFQRACELEGADRQSFLARLQVDSASLAADVEALLLADANEDGLPLEPPRAELLEPPPRPVQRARGGTLLYASPEQCKHLAGHPDIEALDGRSDLYSLGVMAFRMLTGQLPFARNDSPHEAIQNHLEVEPRRVGSLGVKVPRPLASFVDRCLAKHRDRRWKDASEAYEAMERIVQPPVSRVRVAAVLSGVALLTVAAWYYTRPADEHAVALVDPTVGTVSERVVDTVYAGPQHPLRTLRLESDEPWSVAKLPILRLVDATSGDELEGWSVRWLQDGDGGIELALLEGGKSAATVLELEADRWTRWSSDRITLSALGIWRIAGAFVRGHDETRRLDPRGRRLSVAIEGHPEGRAAIDSIEVMLANELLGETGSPVARDEQERTLYEGPPLDALGSRTSEDVVLSVRARDRAGQEREAELRLALAQEPVDFGSSTGFAGSAEPGAMLLPFPGEVQAVLPGNALLIEASSAARVRGFLEPSAVPIFERSLRHAEPIFVTLEELGLEGTNELPGTLRLELDESAWVDRVTPVTPTRLFPFRFIPTPPELEAHVLGPDFDVPFEDGLAHIADPVGARLIVRTPPGTEFWIEASWSGIESRSPTMKSTELAQGGRQRLTRSGATYELQIPFDEEGTYRIELRPYVLLLGDERGPSVGPEHAYSVTVDRTAPAVDVVLEGGDGTDGEPFLHDLEAQHIVARLRENEALAEVHWTLVRPDGSSQRGRLDPGPVIELPSLAAHQVADGRYELLIEARDRARNAGSDRVAWQVARSGPTLSLVEPRAFGNESLWALGDGRAWNVSVNAQDANGVRKVEVSILREGRFREELSLVRSGDLWELPLSLRPSALPWWAGHELALEIVAHDEAGLESRKVFRGTVPELPRDERPVIAPRGATQATMIEFRVDGEYVFGGRADEGSRPWNVRLQRGLLRPFYLDTREVTREEFLAFLRDEKGWASAACWPQGITPEASRRAQLVLSLAGEPDRAAVGIRWAEATAYATWQGKRLPSLVEWEFAVRGADYADAPSGPTPARADASWPTNLCVGAREWTATPERLVPDALDFPSQCRLYPELLVGTGASRATRLIDGGGGSHWVVGGDSAEEPDWASRSLRNDVADQALTDVGFRCALDGARAQELLEQGNYVMLD